MSTGPATRAGRVSHDVPFVAAGGSDVGRVRDNNEDRVLCDPASRLFAVVDGLGGAAAGEQAAAIAVDTLVARLAATAPRDAAGMRQALLAVNDAIVDAAARNDEWTGMGCVATVAIYDEARLILGHVGDTRAYLLSAGALTKISRDHSPVGVQEDEGRIGETTAMRHPRRNEVARALGTARLDAGEPLVDVYELPFDATQALLLCSDGLTDQVSAATLRAIVARSGGEPERVVLAMIAAANEAGGADNVSVVWLQGVDFDWARYALPAPPSAAAPRSPARRSASIGPAVLAAAAVALAVVYSPLVGRLGAPVAAAPETRPAIDAGSDPAVVARPTAGGGPEVTLTTVLQGPERTPRTWTVGAGAQFPTIAAAIAVAEDGDTVIVEPGVYAERLSITKAIVLESRVVGGAVVRPPGAGTPAAAAISIEHLRRGRIVGLRLVGSGGRGTGLSIRDANVEVEDVEFSDWEIAVRIAGRSSAVVRGNRLLGSAGSAIVVEAPATPRIAHNLIEAQGKSAAVGGDGATSVENVVRVVGEVRRR